MSFSEWREQVDFAIGAVLTSFNNVNSANFSCEKKKYHEEFSYSSSFSSSNLLKVAINLFILH